MFTHKKTPPLLVKASNVNLFGTYSHYVVRDQKQATLTLIRDIRLYGHLREFDTNQYSGSHSFGSDTISK